MDANVVVPKKPRGGGKVKNEPAPGKNRPVLREIGNLESLQVVEVISRPVTRSFCAQLLTNEQAAEKNKVVIDDEVATTRKCIVLKKTAEAKNKLSENPDPDNGIVLKSGEQENVKALDAQKELESESVISRSPTVEDEKVKPVNGIVLKSDKQENVEALDAQKELESESVISRSSPVEDEKVKPVNVRKSRNKVKTLTSILSARSKAACGIVNKPKDLIVSIDATDVNDELAGIEYVDDLYTYYKLTEEESRVKDYMVSQRHINAKMRTILVDWLIEVHNRFELMPETLYLAINILDRYLSLKTVSRRKLQLVGITSMLIACKYEEIWAPMVNDFVSISDYAYVGADVLVMEKVILEKLGWYLSVPTQYVFLVRFLKASVSPDQQMENMVFYLAELGLIHYSAIIHYCPSMLAAAAVYAANCTLNKTPCWTETLKFHTGYCEEQLKDCAKLLVSFHLAAAESESKSAVYKKFSSPDQSAVALLTPAEELLAS